MGLQTKIGIAEPYTTAITDDKTGTHSTLAVSDDEAEIYIDPKEERAFVSNYYPAQRLGSDKCKALASRSWFPPHWLPWLYVQVHRSNQHLQCIRLRNERRSKPLWQRTELLYHILQVRERPMPQMIHD